MYHHNRMFGPKIRLLGSGLILLICFTTSNAQTITTDPFNSSVFCQDDIVTVNFSASSTFIPGNEFIVQLSNATGSFDNPAIIGRLTSTNSIDRIDAQIPGGTPFGSGYRIRVFSTKPLVIGSDNGTDLTINTNSQIASVTSGSNNICPGTNVNLTANGVVAGTGAVLTWYDGPAGTGKNLGTANPLKISPLNTTTYYARLAGTCNSVEKSITVTVDQTQSMITSVTADANNICLGADVNLTANGVVAGTGAVLTWYDGPAGTGKNLGTANPLIVSPVSTTTYYARLDGICNDEEESIIITVDPVSSISSVTADANNICLGTDVNLTANGVVAGAGAELTWYDGPAGTGKNLGTANPLIVSPASTTTYYARLAGACNNVEESVTITVDPVSSISSVTADAYIICPGTNVNLTANGVVAGTGAELTWYDGPAGTGKNLGTANPLIVSPASTTTYYARLAGTCNEVEESTTVTVEQESSINSVTSDTNDVCPGTAVTITVDATFGTDAVLIWYEGPPSNKIEVGRSNPIIVYPFVNTTYYATLDGKCNYVEEPITIRAEDVTPPVVITRDITTSLDDSGQAMIGVDQIDNGSWDICGIATRELDRTNFDCSDPGDHVITLTVTDNSGNVNSETALVRVTDNIPPVITCPGDIESTDPVVDYQLPTATDNCSGVSINLIEGIATGSGFPVGSTKITYQAMDQSGNTSSCSFTVTIIDTNQAPTDILLSNTIITEVTGETIVGILSTIDPDIDDAHTYTLPGPGNGHEGVFSINGDQLVINSGFEEYLAGVKEISVKIRSTDRAGAFVEKEFLLSVIQEVEHNNFPTAFTPNNDGVNDVWEVGENQIDPMAEMWIYDINGQLVFSSRGYETPWDGRYRGKEQPVGTYYYVIKLDGKKQKQGFVMILK